MAKVSVIIPARGERLENLNRTLESVYKNATGDFEVIVGFDDKFDFSLADVFGLDQKNFSYIRFPGLVGIKTNINAMASMAKGEYLFKLDAHCSVGKGFDEILQATMKKDWLVMPRFYVLNGETWEWQKRKGIGEYYDYFFLCCPFTDPRGFRFKAGGHWRERTVDKLETPLDETPQIHGSGWFITRDRYFQLGGFPNIDPHGHAQEPIWLALKNWLMGGKVMVNKKTWYAHMHQQGNRRGYHMDRNQEKISYDLAAKFFVGDEWFQGKQHTFEWFVDKFMPMPTWPDDWKDLLYQWRAENVI